MALILRNNPAPLSGALFVKNPRRRRRKMKMNRKARRSLRFFNGIGAGLTANRKNRKRRSSRAKKGVLARLIAKFRRNRSAVKMNRSVKMNRRRRSLRRLMMNRAHGMMKLNRRRRSRKNPMKSFRTRKGTVSFFAKKNRRHRRNPEASASGGFNLPILAPVKSLVSKVPFIGHPVAQALGYIAFGAAAGATHYYGMKAVRYVGGMLPAGVQDFGRKYVAPVGYSLTGVLANFALQRLPVPFLSDDQKRKLGVAAMIAGGVLDVYRAIKGQSSDLGDYDYGDGGAYDVVPLAGIGEGFGAIGEGMGAIGEGMGGMYSDAELADAMFSGPDLDSYEGEAALAGPPAFMRAFPPPPKVASRREAAHSRHAGRRGHRWGWLIKMIGFNRFYEIAAMPEPEARVALIAALRQEAVAAAAQQAAVKQAEGVSGIGMAGIGFSGIGEGFGMVASEGMGELGFMAAGSAY